MIYQVIQDVKKKVTGFKWVWYSIEQQSPRWRMSRNQCLLRYGQYLSDIYSTCYMWFPCISAQLSALAHGEECTLLKIPGFTWISWQAFSTHCCNTSKSLISAEFTKVFRYPHNLKPRWLKPGDHACQLNGPPHPIYCSPKSGSGTVWLQRKWGGALSCMNHVLSKWHMFQEYW
jgi:hypothetical protein